MAEKTFYQKCELGVGLAGLIVGLATLFFTSAQPLVIAPERLLKWLGVALLGQGLIRDIVLLLTRSGKKQAGGVRKLLICLESTLGAGLIALAFGLGFLDPQQQFFLTPAWLMLVFAALWLFGFSTRDVVLEMRRDPNHINLLVGIPGRKAR